MTKRAYSTENIPKLKRIIFVLSFALIVTNIFWLGLLSTSKYELLELSVINEDQTDNSITLVLTNSGFFPIEFSFIKVNDEYVSVYVIDEFIIAYGSSMDLVIDFDLIFDVPPMNHFYTFEVYCRSGRVYWVQWVGLP